MGYYGRKKRNLKPLALAFSVVLGVFGSYWMAGMDSFSSPPPISQSKPASVQTKKSQTLEDMLNSSQKIVMKATYEVPNMFNPAEPKEVSLYGFGSSICVYKNLNEQNLFFLTCDHVTAAPQEILVMDTQLGLKKVEKNLYETKIKFKNQDISFYVLLDEDQGPMQAPFEGIQIAKLKSASLGVYGGTIKDDDGNITDFKTTPLTELADTGFREDDEDWIKNNDISLLRVDTSKMKEGEIYSQLNKFSVWEGKWADFGAMKQGDAMKVVGYPLAFERQIDSGELTSKEATEKSLNENYYFTSAHINPGNSGGPAFLVVEKYKLQDGQIVKEQEFLFAGLARLGYSGEGMGGILRPDVIMEFLKQQGYRYLIK